MGVPIGPVHHRSPVAAKIALFRSLFRGRDDVYPRRFESRKTGKSGYQPACANQWVRGVCEKPRIKCLACPHRRFLAVTDDVIRCHLSGRDDNGQDFVMGVYPMLQDETSFFLAVDLDKTHWQEDAQAMLETCQQKNVAAALERSRSGNGGHIWLFFRDAIPATLARKLGAHLLTETMERRPDIGLDSYDRFFPNQDTLPQGGLGNLIDGTQHLANEDAYRRDRRKDQLLQEHDYFVLRFLAGDVGTHLDTVLDAILRTLSRRRRT
jgi:hypothetical protein